jgi:DNA-binding NarL/FixJ family response regulator
MVRIHPIDLVITDLLMPEGEGIETIRHLRKEHPEIRIIAMSGAFGSELLAAARFLGADAILSKPLTPDRVLSCIHSLSRLRRTN